jgi:putative ABC transport system permease protein
VHLVNGPRERRTSVMALSRTGELRQLVDVDRRRVPLPFDGLAIDERLARHLGVGAGDSVTVEVQEGRRLVRRVVVARVYRSTIGNLAYADTALMRVLTNEAPLATGAFLVTDADAEEALAARLKELPRVAGVGFKRTLVASFEATIAENMSISNLMLTVFASVIAIAIVYNGLRIALSERSRELASLRVLGFTEREVGAMLLGEFLLLTLVGVPLGFAVGYGFCAAITLAFETDLYRIPLVVSRQTYAYALGVMLASFAATATVMARRVGRLDLVAALKMRE